MHAVQRAIDRLANAQTVDGDAIDWSRWLKPSDTARIVPAESLAEECKRDMLLGREAEQGLSLPWMKTRDRVLIRAHKLVIWTGWQHHGKSQMLKQVMVHAMLRGEKVLIASMEEEIREVWLDMARLFCGTETPTPRMIDLFITAATGKLWLYDQQGVVDGQRMQAVCRYAAAELGVTQSVIDSLMMLKGDRDDYNSQSQFCSELKTLAKDSKQTIHLVAHMRKPQGRGEETTPGSAHDIAGGHEIASKADYVFNVWRNKDRKEPEDPAALLCVEKQRGRLNWLGKIALEFHADSRQFVEHENQPIPFWNSVGATYE